MELLIEVIEYCKIDLNDFETNGHASQQEPSTVKIETQASRQGRIPVKTERPSLTSQRQKDNDKCKKNNTK